MHLKLSPKRPGGAGARAPSQAGIHQSRRGVCRLRWGTLIVVAALAATAAGATTAAAATTATAMAASPVASKPVLFRERSARPHVPTPLMNGTAQQRVVAQAADAQHCQSCYSGRGIGGPITNTNHGFLAGAPTPVGPASILLWLLALVLARGAYAIWRAPKGLTSKPHLTEYFVAEPGYASGHVRRCAVRVCLGGS